MKTKKELYLQKAEAKLNELKSQIDVNLARLSETKADAQLKIKENLEDLLIRQETVVSRLEDIRNAGEDTWEEMRDNLEDTIDEFEASFNKMAEEFGEAVS